MQLTLGIQPTEELTFSNFCIDDNQQVIASLKKMCEGQGESLLILHGQPTVGKTHLLQACCHEVNSHKKRAAYIPLREIEKLSPLILEELEQLSLVSIDDLHFAVGKRNWEEALFHFYNRAQFTQTRIVMSSLLPPTQLEFLLKDLRSRLLAHQLFVIKPLSDAQKIIALQLHAKQKGMELSEEVGAYLLHHCPRNMHALLRVLEKLDSASLAEQRKLTIPFVKEVLFSS